MLKYEAPNMDIIFFNESDTARERVLDVFEDNVGGSAGEGGATTN